MPSRTKQLQTAALMSLCLFIAPVFADGKALTYDRINLDADASEEVQNDTLVAVLYMQKEGRSTVRLAKEVNRELAWAVRLAKDVPGIKVQTLDYRTTPIYQKRARTGWRVRQSLRLESRDAVRLSQLVGELQERLAVGNIAYTISPERRRQAENRLISRAIAAFKERARLIAAELDQPAYRLVRMDVNTSGQPFRPRIMGAAMEMKAASAPTLEAGAQRVRVSVSGTIELREK
ncbi:MAG TPA: DUF541 domain-containing protein [Sedimenticola sp.]|nr:DUF541 domain-containing protein [Sedimenticola sp.]